MTSHAELVRALCKPGADIKESLTPHQAHCLHMAVGICGEAGELLDAIKKHAIYQQDLDLPNVVEELGDLMFFIEGLMQALSVTRETCLHYNIEKLTKRYGKEYSDKAAQERKDKA